MKFGLLDIGSKILRANHVAISQFCYKVFQFLMIS
jgi:hypothetical protein